MKNPAPIFDGIVNAQHELDGIAMHVESWPPQLIVEGLQNTIDLLEAMKQAVERREN